MTVIASQSIYREFNNFFFSFSVMDHHSKPATCTNSTSAPTQNNEFVGYIHNVSPVSNENFFECQLQGRDETITKAVCFTPSFGGLAY